MKIVVAIDSFKGSLSSLEAGSAIKEGIQHYIDADVHVFPLSDGGEGFMESYMTREEGILRSLYVHDAMLRKIPCSYVILHDGKTAIMEAASMCGITHINTKKNDILHASTFGLGEMIMDAMDQGCREFVIGMGGTGTNDGGSGVLKALGFQLLDEYGKEIPSGAYGLSKLASIKCVSKDRRLDECKFLIACDVENPLLGINGCSHIFAPQKGATKTMITEMDYWLSNYEKIINRQIGFCDPMVKGAGAAGGLGFAFMSVLHGTLVSGMKLIADNMQLREWIADCDLVITGEGCLDDQTIMGKAPSGIARIAKEYQKPVIALAGTLTKDSDLCNANGIDAFFSIQRSPCTLEEAMDKTNAAYNLSKTAEQVVRLYHRSLRG